MNAEPDPIAVSDELFARQVHHIHRARWAAVITILVVLICGTGYLGTLANTQQDQIRIQQGQISIQNAEIRSLEAALRLQQKEVQSSCGFWRLLAVLPPAPRPNLTGVTLLVDSRNTYLGLGCGRLPPPSAALLHWAAYYHLPIIG